MMEIQSACSQSMYSSMYSSNDFKIFQLNFVLIFSNMLEYFNIIKDQTLLKIISGNWELTNAQYQRFETFIIRESIKKFVLQNLVRKIMWLIHWKKSFQKMFIIKGEKGFKFFILISVFSSFKFLDPVLSI